MLVPATKASELEDVIESVARGECVPAFETQRVTKDGRILDICVAISAIRDSTGTVTGAATVARDLTEIHRSTAAQHVLEEQLRRANGFLNKLAGALRRQNPPPVVGGQGAFLRELPGVPRQPGTALTPRELEVLELMARGVINKQIAKHLGLRLNTVRNHSQSVLYKLNAHSRLEAVATAARDGIIAYPLETNLE